MHLMGNHGSYEQRYPKAFEKYDGKIPLINMTTVLFITIM